MSIIAGSEKELQELLKKKSLHQPNNTVSKIVAFRETETVDRDRYVDRLLVQALDENGIGVPNQLIQFVLEDLQDTGTFFIFTDDGKEYPVKETIGFTDPGGFTLAIDQIKTGKTSGTVSIKVTAPSSGGEATAIFTRHLSPQTPAEILPILGGDESFPPGSYALVDLRVKLLDTQHQPVPHGVIRFSIYDPFETGTVLVFGGYVALYTDSPVSSEGIAAVQLPVAIGSNNPGGKFYIRADRRGKTPFHLFTYTITKENS
jgi:hypothetical protein